MTILLNEPVAANFFAVALPMPGPVVTSVIRSFKTPFTSVACRCPKRQEYVPLTASFNALEYLKGFKDQTRLILEVFACDGTFLYLSSVIRNVRGDRASLENKYQR